MSSKYQRLLNEPIEIDVVENAREVIIETTSCMCDNINHLDFTKDENGDFYVSGRRDALSNWQMAGDYQTDLRWAADDQDWNKVVSIINTGTSKVSKIRSR